MRGFDTGALMTQTSILASALHTVTLAQRCMANLKVVFSGIRLNAAGRLLERCSFWLPPTRHRASASRRGRTQLLSPPTVEPNHRNAMTGYSYVQPPN
jgi:hypothetical protein